MLECRFLCYFLFYLLLTCKEAVNIVKDVVNTQVHGMTEKRQKGKENGEKGEKQGQLGVRQSRVEFKRLAGGGEACEGI